MLQSDQKKEKRVVHNGQLAVNENGETMQRNNVDPDQVDCLIVN